MASGVAGQVRTARPDSGSQELQQRHPQAGTAEPIPDDIGADHLLALWIAERAKARALEGGKLLFDYDRHGTKVSTLEPHRCKVGYTWADDLKLSLEQEIKEIDREIKEVRRAAAISPTLEEKLSCQKKQRELEGKRGKLWRELFDRQDEVEAQRNKLIGELEDQIKQQVEERTLFTVEWELA
jgi:hypothetical protein